ncbi:MAG: hypothetical protein K6F52_00825 [Clostridia bacterium]|nr:hypothetical protein [Clostridia bacterium]
MERKLQTARKEIEIKSYAKINLALDVLGKRPDGYHEVDMVMQLVDLSDIVRVSVQQEDAGAPADADGTGSDANAPAEGYAAEAVVGADAEEKGAGSTGSGAEAPAEAPGAGAVADSDAETALEIEVRAGSPDLPEDRDNIAYRAAELMYGQLMKTRNPQFAAGQPPEAPEGRRAKEEGGAHRIKIIIEIQKNIPIAAGLAGGSGNGAAVIHALNILWDLKLSLAELEKLGAKLGSDIPFCIVGMAAKEANPEVSAYLKDDAESISTCARATGTGTTLTVLPPLDAYVVLCKPPISVSTAEVYRGIDSVTITKRPKIEALIAGLKEKSLREVAKNVDNVLEFFTFKRYHCVMYTKNTASENTDAEAVLMSGSGPTVFSLYESAEKAAAAFDVLRKENRQTYLCRTLCYRQE